MTNDISIATKRTTKEKLRKYFIISLIAGSICCGTGGGIWGADHLIQKSLHNKRINKVEKAIAFNDYVLASTLIERYEKEERLKSAELDELRLELKRGKGISKLQKLIDDCNIQSSHEVLSELEKSGIYTPEQIEKFGEMIKGLNEGNLIERIKAAKTGALAGREYLMKLCEDYLKLHPKGKDAKIVAKRLWIEKFRDYKARMKKNERIDILIDLTRQLNEDIKKNGLKMDISKVIREEDLYAELLSYVGKKREPSYDAVPGALRIGAKVGVIGYYPKWYETDEYINALLKNFPLGSIGEIIDKYDDEWIVEFDKNQSYSWDNKYSPLPKYFQQRGHQGIGLFKSKELTVVRFIDNSEIREFETEFEELWGTYQRFLISQE